MGSSNKWKSPYLIPLISLLPT